MGLDIKNIESNEITLLIKKEEIKKTLENILNKYELEDLQISEPPVDEIIGKLLTNNN